MKKNKALLMSILFLMVAFLSACNSSSAGTTQQTGSQTGDQGDSNSTVLYNAGDQSGGDASDELTPTNNKSNTGSNENFTTITPRSKPYGLISHTTISDSQNGITYVDFEKGLIAEAPFEKFEMNNNLEYTVKYFIVDRYDGSRMKRVGEIEGFKNNCAYNDSIMIPNNRWAVYCSQSNLAHEARIELWDLDKMEQISSGPADDSIRSLITSPDGNILIGSYRDSSDPGIKIWEIPTLKELPIPGFMGYYTELESSLNNEYFWGDNHFGVYMYKFSNGNIIDITDQVPFNQITKGLYSFNEDNTIVAIFNAWEDEIAIWDRVNNKEISKINNSTAFDMMLSPKGDQLVIVNWNPNSNNTIEFIDTSDGRVLNTIIAEGNSIPVVELRYLPENYEIPHEWTKYDQ